MKGRDVVIRPSGLGIGTGKGAFAVRGVERGVRVRVGVYEGERLEGWGPEVLQGRDLGSVAQVSGQKEGKGVWVDGAVGGNWTSRVQGGGGHKKQFTALCQRGGGICWDNGG